MPGGELQREDDGRDEKDERDVFGTYQVSLLICIDTSVTKISFSAVAPHPRKYFPEIFSGNFSRTS